MDHSLVDSKKLVIRRPINKKIEPIYHVKQLGEGGRYGIEAFQMGKKESENIKCCIK